MSNKVNEALKGLDDWINKSNWISYDPFDGLSAPLARKITFEIPLLRIALQQSVRRLPFNIRPLLEITKKRSNQAMGYLASGYSRFYKITGQSEYLEKTKYCLSDLLKNNSQGYNGYAWGWMFDYQSRGDYSPRGFPSVVWTSFIGHGFLDAYQVISDPSYLDVARSACEFILKDLPRQQKNGDSLCISYVPTMMIEIHNANMLAASLLSRVYHYTKEDILYETARRAVQYTMDNQHSDGSWYYGEGLRYHWVDGYHTGFILDSLFYYAQSTDDHQFDTHLMRGVDYYRTRMFNGAIAKHYNTNTYPIDIQSIAQAIQTFTLIPENNHGDVTFSEQIALWAIDHMQDASGFFYFRKNRLTTNKTPFLHWGQATMLTALTLLVCRQQGLQDRPSFHHKEKETK